MPTRKIHTPKNDKRKNHPDRKRTSKGISTHPQQIYIHNVPSYDVENTYGTNKGKDLLFANKIRTVPRRTERKSQEDQMNR